MQPRKNLLLKQSDLKQDSHAVFFQVYFHLTCTFDRCQDLCRACNNPEIIWHFGNTVDTKDGTGKAIHILHIIDQGQDCSTVQAFLVFFVPTGAQEILISVHSSVCSVQTCLELSIVIFLHKSSGFSLLAPFGIFSLVVSCHYFF